MILVVSVKSFPVPVLSKTVKSIKVRENIMLYLTEYSFQPELFFFPEDGKNMLWLNRIKLPTFSFFLFKFRYAVATKIIHFTCLLKVQWKKKKAKTKTCALVENWALLMKGYQKFLYKLGVYWQWNCTKPVHTYAFNRDRLNYVN